MARWVAGVEYLGGAYAGWQAQGGPPSVQAQLEAALSKVADHPVAVTAAGRTDAGVHALQQVIHFDTAAQRSAYSWLLGSNTNLPHDVSVRWIQPIADRFHARFSAVRRSYRYVIHNHRARSALVGGRAGWWPVSLEAAAMHEAAQALIGEHDFSAFRDSQCQSTTPMRRLDRIEVTRKGEFIVVDVTGNAFLHHMVRNITGVLAEIGQGRRPVAWARDVLASRDRTQGGMTVPACGLYFVGPEYPAEFAVPSPPLPHFP
ncbi:MAG TPA: tRNA pseudouridine(38-40) synthase TruA [Nevskiaceae bacterium]|nr:tRNA pseudouridine(38-40) synthase TruA [Nevskiaceae bacterium]